MFKNCGYSVLLLNADNYSCFEMLAIQNLVTLAIINSKTLAINISEIPEMLAAIISEMSVNLISRNAAT